MALHLRLICCVTPWAVAGLRFGRGPARAFGVAQRPLDEFSEADLRELFTDPRIDVSLGVQHEQGDWAFIPVADELDLVRVRQLVEAVPAEQAGPAPRGTMEVLADHAALEAERARDAAAPGGDDEDLKDTTAAPAAEATPPEAASGGEADQPAAAEESGTAAATSTVVEAAAEKPAKPAKK